MALGRASGIPAARNIRQEIAGACGDGFLLLQLSRGGNIRRGIAGIMI
jgi:hypothetical protein